MASVREDLYRLEPLGHHDRHGFSCGVESLDSYLKNQASQDIRRKADAVFVLVPSDELTTIAGYFTLCAYGLSSGTIPEAAQKHTPRYPVVSATLIGRLAVSKGRQGKGLGSVLLAQALHKAFENSSVVGSSMVVVDAIDDRAVRFYEAYGFVKLHGSMRLVLPIRLIAKL
jgi:GNAT superfamily N-acetyltransferase